jgi:pimeloyl-ACP methyl ester carboxylesterase
MTASVAFKAVKTHVQGVALEVLRIALPGASPTRSPIVFLHEGLGSVAMWRDFPAQLCAAVGREGIVYSRRGYGQSDAVPDVRGAGRLKPDYMHCEAAEVLPELLRLLGIERPVLLGHSDGATIALLHAARFDVEACIVMAPHLFVEDISIAAIAQAREAFERGNLRDRLAKYHADVDGAFWQWNDIWLSPEFRSFNIEEECQRITCPLLAIQGHDDPYGTMAQIDALGDFYSKNGISPACNMRRVLSKIEQCGHSPHRDQTEVVIQAIQQFLA